MQTMKVVFAALTVCLLLTTGSNANEEDSDDVGPVPSPAAHPTPSSTTASRVVDCDIRALWSPEGFPQALQRLAQPECEAQKAQVFHSNGAAAFFQNSGGSMSINLHAWRLVCYRRISLSLSLGICVGTLSSFNVLPMPIYLCCHC